MKSAFYRLHPSVSFAYFAIVLAFTMIFSHPVCLFISFMCGALYAFRLFGRAAFCRRLSVILALMLFTAVLNPLFSHRGVTILAYLPGGNPLTAESLIYGLAAALMLGASAMWFLCFNAVMDSDKIICLFGQIMPSVSLVITITLRLIPLYIRRMKDTWDIQKCADCGDGGHLAKIKSAFSVISSVTSWALESGIETADSMKARGYASGRRTSYSIYRFDTRDALCISIFTALGAAFAVLAAFGAVSCSYFPVFAPELSAGSFAAFSVFAALGLSPLILDIQEALKWRSLRSKT